MEIIIKQVRLSEIKLNPDNPRRISSLEMDMLVESIKKFPEMMSLREIVVDETMTVLGGNMRTLALRKLKQKECTAKIVTGLTPEQKREFIVKDNGSWGQWDMELLSSWDDLPLIDWGVSIPKAWVEPQESPEPQSQGRMYKNFNEGKGADDEHQNEEQNPYNMPAQGKYPVTVILDQNQWEIWESVKENMKLRDDKAAFLKLIGG